MANLETLPVQHVDDVSLKPILEGKALDIQRLLLRRYLHYGNQGGNTSSVIRKDKWKLVYYYEDGNEELYDLSNDVGKQSQVIKEHPLIADILSKQLLGWLEAVEANHPKPDSEYNAKLTVRRHQNIVNEKLSNLNGRN